MRQIFSVCVVMLLGILLFPSSSNAQTFDAWFDVVKDGGCSNNGSDVTTCINTFLTNTVIPANSGNGVTLFFPPGTYGISGTGLNITGGNGNIRLLGAAGANSQGGQAASVLNFTGALEPMPLPYRTTGRTAPLSRIWLSREA